MKTACIVAIAIVVGLFLTEVFSVNPVYKLYPATVRKVVKNPPWHYVGCDEMTLIRFDDGFADEMSGNRGEPGDRIMVYRQCGTSSLFGILGKEETK